ARRLTDEIRRIEGEEGTWWRYGEAANLVGRAAEKNDASLTEARKLIDDLAKRRPSWTRVLLLSGQLHRRPGNVERALENYQEAIKRGDVRSALIRRTASLLYERRKFQEADAVIRRLPDQTALPAELGRLAADIALRSGDPQRAAELAQGVSVKSSDFRI